MFCWEYTEKLMTNSDSEKIKKAFIKPFEAPQRSVKIKI